MRRLVLYGLGVLLAFAFLVPTAQAKVFNKNIIQNGGFENGATNWNCYIQDAMMASECYVWGSYDELQNAGEFYFVLSRYSSLLTMHQKVTIPKTAGKATLSYYYKFITSDVKESDDTFSVVVLEKGKNNAMKSIARRTITPPKSINEWRKVRIDLSQYRGSTVTVLLAMVNDDKKISAAHIDSVSLRVKSRSLLKGKVKHADGSLATGSKVVIKSAKGKKLWKGTTNSNGAFGAGKLKGLKKKVRIIVHGDDGVQTFRKRIKWGKRYTRTFTLD